MLGKEVQNVYLNGEVAGETRLNAGLAGSFGVPVALVAGDAIGQSTRQVLLTPMAEALPWLLPDFRPTPLR
jgi:D-aminopeptidase